MLKLIKRALLAAVLIPALTMQAQEAAITMRTNIYDTAGPSNLCTIALGGTPNTYVEVDCGFGKVEYQIKEATFDQTTQTINGTPISCQVSKEGIIKIYTDEGTTLDYFNAEGCGLEWVEFVDPATIQILNLNHNSLSRLDLSGFKALQIAYLSDNPYDVSPLVIGEDHPDLAMLEINGVPNIDPNFDIRTYPELLILDAFSVPGITKLTPSGCPKLVRLSIDCTNVSELDLSKNADLSILNISETAITDIDLSGCPNLTQLYVTHQSDTYNPDVKLKHLDVSMLPKLYYLFATGNDLERIDVSKNTQLDHLWLNHNKLTHLDISHCPNITSLRLDYNYFDFTTLPAIRETFNEYEYVQHPFPVHYELEVGKPLDLTAYINRPGTETYARLMSVKRENPYNPTAVDSTKYTFANGQLTVNEAITDSVYVELVNSAFTAIAQVTSQATTRFKVKNTGDMGKPDLQMSFQHILSKDAALKMCVGIEGASAENPKTLYVVQGDRTTTFDITTSAMPDAANVTVAIDGYEVKLYTEVSERISAVGIDDVYMTACDLTNATSLRDLRLTGTELYSLDLGYNRFLEKLVLTGNHLGAFSLDGVSGDFYKNMLTYIDLSNNEITSVTLSYLDAIEHYDLSHNRLTEITLKDAERIGYLDLSYNQLTTLTINYLSSLRELHAQHNALSTYVAPETNVIEYADFSHNNFTYATLPARRGMDEDHFVYAPQAKIQITTKAPGIDLGSQAVTIDGKPVVFTWLKADGTPLVEGTDYVITQGRTRFLAPAVDAEVHCVMTCESLPAFAGENALMTTSVQAAEMPTHIAATFRTVEAGTMQLSLGAHHNGSSIYIDWNGDGTDVVQYVLNDTYTLFEAQTKAGADVKVYSYNEDNDVRVFSIGGVKLGSFDGTNLKDIIALTLSNTGLSAITFPATDGIRELNLEGNALTEFDATKFTQLTSLSLTDNGLTSLDITPCPNLLLVAAARNQLTEVKCAKDNEIFFLDLTDNLLENYDLQQHPQLNQVGLAGNRLTQINPSNLPSLRVLAIDNNRFTFATLPLPEAHWSRYTYANQAPVEAVVNGLVVDLSSQKEVNGTPTTYRWFIGMPTTDPDTGELVGEELVVDEEYTLTDGITTLKQGFNNMICLMTNTELPNVILTTDLLMITALEGTTADGMDAEAVYYTLDGRRVAQPAAGIYIVVRGDKVTKEYIQ